MDPDAGLAIESATGVDLSLAVAGPGVRSFAFLIDWHIRTLLGIAWYVIAAFAHNRGTTLTAPVIPGGAWFVGVIAPTALIYFLYHPVLEVAMRGSTPGKRMAGVRLITRNGAAPGVGPLMVRNVFRLVDCLPLAYAVGLVTTMLTQHNVRVGDLAAGTLLVYVRADSFLPAEGLSADNSSTPLAVRLDATRTEIAGELVQRWPSLDADARSKLARQILQRAGVAAATDDGALLQQLQSLNPREGA